jgi:hypothetical protein
MKPHAGPLPACPGTERLKAFVDGETNAAEAARLRGHVEGCAACAQEVWIMRKIGEGLGELAGAAEPPAGMRERLLASLPDAAGPASRWNWPVIWRASLAGGVATLVTVAVLAVTSPVQVSTVAGGREMKQMPAAAEAPAAGGAAPMGGLPSVAPSPAPSAPGAPQAQARANGDAYGGSYGGTGINGDDIDRWVRGSESEPVERKVVQTADLTLQVKRSLEEAEKSVTRQVVSGGGYVESSEVTTAEDGERRAELALRVPVARFEPTVEWLVDFGVVKAKQIRGEDVTGRYVDQRALVRELRAEERTLGQRLKSAKKPAERDALRWELVRLRGRIRGAEERLAATAKLAALSTIRLRLVQPAPGSTGAGLVDDAGAFFQGAQQTFLRALRVPVAIAIWVVVFAPLWVPALLAFRWVAGRSRV